MKEIWEGARIMLVALGVMMLIVLMIAAGVFIGEMAAFYQQGRILLKEMQ